MPAAPSPKKAHVRRVAHEGRAGVIDLFSIAAGLALCSGIGYVAYRTQIRGEELDRVFPFLATERRPVKPARPITVQTRPVTPSVSVAKPVTDSATPAKPVAPSDTVANPATPADEGREEGKDGKDGGKDGASPDDPDNTYFGRRVRGRPADAPH